MTGFLLRIIINAVLLVAVIAKLPGVFIDTLGGTLLGAAIIGLANAAIGPVLSYLSVPFQYINLGAITLVTNLVTPLMVIKTLPGYQISGFFTPTVGMLLITVCSVALTKTIQDR